MKSKKATSLPETGGEDSGERETLLSFCLASPLEIVVLDQLRQCDARFLGDIVDTGEAPVGA